MKKNILIALLSLLMCSFAAAQTAESYIIAAQRETEIENYIAALDYYRAAYHLDTTNIELVKIMATLSREYNLYDDAMQWYELACRKDSLFAFEQGLFYLGMMQKSNGMYQEALRSFLTYSRTGKQDELIKSANKQMLSTEIALKILNDTHQLVLNRLDRNINTAHSDFGAIPVSSNRIFFTSIQPISQGSYGNLFPEFASIWRSVIYSSRLTLAGYTKPIALPNVINKRNTHNGSISKVAGKRAYYFVRCTGDLNNEGNCGIYYIEMSGNSWQKPIRLPDRINLPSHSALHPCFVRMENHSVLYFVSDRPGGYGGKDIWYTLIADGEYGEPVNLGSTINTEANEVTPLYHGETSTLYFSSDGHAGLGGYDIFTSRGGLNAWEKPMNMAIPFNSPGDDLYFFMNEQDSSGYFTSNRPRSAMQKSSTCCGDIFYFEWQHDSKPAIETEVPKDSMPPETHIRALLPLALYFHNDEPDPKSFDTLTRRNYRETLIAYLDMKEKYEEEYSKGLKGEPKTRAQQDIRAFFENYIEKGYLNLEQISKWLIEDLREGYSVTIHVSGFASPLNTTQYNLNLSKRRINSFINYLYEFREGLLTPYLTNTAANGARLIIIEQPEGDSKALPFVSSNPNDKRNSIYSRSAAFERRIEILSYKSSRSEPQAILSWELSTLDMGRVQRGTIEKRVIRIQNHGNAPARLQFVTPGCDCLSVSFKEDVEILPGGFTEINLSFNPAEQYPGPYHEILSAGFYGVENFIMLNVAAFIVE